MHRRRQITATTVKYWFNIYAALSDKLSFSNIVLNLRKIRDSCGLFSFLLKLKLDFYTLQGNHINSDLILSGTVNVVSHIAYLYPDKINTLKYWFSRNN